MTVRHTAAFAALAVLSGSLAFGQFDVAPPAVPPGSATQAAPAPVASGAAAPATAATAPGQPSAQSVLENLLNTRPTAIAPAPVPPAGATASAETRPGAIAPDQPAVNRIPEGGFVYNRVGRLTKDEKTSEWIFVFDADGKNLKDPPMGMVPSRMLMAMQKASDNGTKATKFRVSGEVTEYEGKNYLYVKDQRIVQDLNQGIGG